MMEVSLWMLVFVMLQSNGEIATQEIDIFGHIDDCMYAAEIYVAQAEDPKPYNWDFVCLEMSGEDDV